MRTTTLALVALAASGCGGTQSGAADATDAEADEDPSDPLRGAWWTGVAPDGDPLPCALEIEVFADGTAELDFLSDDNSEKSCSFGRVPVTREAGNPPVVRFGGQLSACRWRREGRRLRLACEDHERPPSDFDVSILLERKHVREREGLPALVGTWVGPAFWGPPASLVIEANGQVTFEGSAGHLEVRPGWQLDLVAGSIASHCRYRALDDRLTLRCSPAGAPAPEGFAGAATMTETIVFRRAGPWARGPVIVDPHRGEAAGGGDPDGDGIIGAQDRCPASPEDYDDFEDGDGCPDADNDRDGIADVDDECPLVPEDRDGDADGDGCPESGGGDRDGDGLLDARDRCPDDPEDRDTFEDEDGCPDPDNDRDRILDVDDVCPNEPEDYDGHADDDGCPDR